MTEVSPKDGDKLANYVPQTDTRVDENTKKKEFLASSDNAQSASSTPSPPTVPAGPTPSAPLPSMQADPTPPPTHMAERTHVPIGEYNAVLGRVDRLKALLLRSSKASKEAAAELTSVKNQLSAATSLLRELEHRLESVRPAPPDGRRHTADLDLLRDFESELDRALASVAGPSHQTGGEEKKETSSYRPLPPPSPPISTSPTPEEAESAPPNSSPDTPAMVSRVCLLEEQAATLRRDRDSLSSDLSASRAEARRLRAVVRRMELDSAAERVEREEEVAAAPPPTPTTAAPAVDEEMVVQAPTKDDGGDAAIITKMGALTEWAEASAEAKRLAVERAVALERRLRSLQAQMTAAGGAEAGRLPAPDEKILFSASDEAQERRLWIRSGSLVIGAGEKGRHIAALGKEVAESVLPSEDAVLRWRFDVVPSHADVWFAVSVGGNAAAGGTGTMRETPELLSRRLVTGGAGGDLEGAFSVRDSCTLVWDNTHAWVLPKTIRFSLEAIAIV